MTLTRSPLSLPEWLDPALTELVRELVEPILPDAVEVPVSPQAAVTSVAKAAQRAYQAGRAATLAELRTTEQAAAELGLTRQRTLLLAKSRGLGWAVGRNVRLFRPEDVDAMRVRKSGRAGWRNNIVSQDSTNSH